jgi:epoxyqueuosine reductase
LSLTLSATSPSLNQKIKLRARALGFDDCRITTALPPASAANFRKWVSDRFHGEMNYLERNADKRVEPERVLPAAKSIITLAVSYSGDNPAAESTEHGTQSTKHGPGNSGLVARYARYNDYHKVIGERLKSFTEFINQLGPADTRSLWYVDTGPLLERDLAQRAGLGFIGKHTNLISRTLGNWIFLAEIITTLELELDPLEQNRCGTCSRCIAACPTKAIKGPFQLDARLCISYLTIELKGAIPVELRPLIGNRIYGCDDCLAVCPWNRFAKEGEMMKAHARHDLATPGLLELLALEENQFRQRFAGTPMLRTKRRGLLRNVCVALGNSWDKSAIPALEQAAADPEPLIAEHAKWAIERIRNKVKGGSELY